METARIVDAKVPSTVVAIGDDYSTRRRHEVPDTVNVLLTTPKASTANLTCTFNNEMGALNPALEILGPTGQLIRSGVGVITFKWSRGARTTAGVEDRGPRRSSACTTPTPRSRPWSRAFTWDPKVEGGVETWQAVGRDDTYTHIDNFFSSVRSRKQPVENA